jgi:hypothetical protein
MKIKVLALLTVFVLVLASSCKKETETFTRYVDLELLGDWQEFDIGPNEEIIFKITITDQTRIDLAWRDIADMDVDDSYTADILFSAYRPDGVSPYFEDIDNGFKDNSQMIDIVEGDEQVLLIVKAKSGQSGAFALRVRGLNDDLVVTNPKDLTFGTGYTDKNIAESDVKWLKVDCGSATNIVTEWMEWDRPEVGSNYTADIQVSVYSEDLETLYVDNKNHGYDTNARTFTLTHETSIIYLRISLYDPLKPGTYAIRVFEQSK